MVKVLFFAKARELTKLSESELNLKSSNLKIQQIYQALETQWPEIKQLKRSFALALNEEYLEENTDAVINFQTNDILAVIPPISGG